MHSALKDKTNSRVKNTIKKDKQLTEKENIISYLREKSDKTNDYDLKYDIEKCIEILEGKENQMFTDLKCELEEVLIIKNKLEK